MKRSFMCLALVACSLAAFGSGPGGPPIVMMQRNRNLVTMLDLGGPKITDKISFETYSDLIGHSLIVPTVSFQTAPASGNWGGSFFHNWRTNTFSAVVINKIGDLTIHGKKTGCEFDGFAGAEIKNGAPAIGGFDIGYRRMVFDQVFVFAGFGVSVSGSSPVGFGGLLGFGIQF